MFMQQLHSPYSLVKGRLGGLNRPNPKIGWPWLHVFGLGLGWAWAENVNPKNSSLACVVVLVNPTQSNPKL